MDTTTFVFQSTFMHYQNHVLIHFETQPLITSSREEFIFGSMDTSEVCKLNALTPRYARNMFHRKTRLRKNTLG